MTLWLVIKSGVNTKTDSLAQNARKQMSVVVHIDAELPVWFAKIS